MYMAARKTSRKTFKRDLQMLRELSVKQKPIVAQQYKLTLRGLDSWLHRIRTRRKECQWYINNILDLEKRNERMKKILLSSKIPDSILVAQQEQDKEDWLMAEEKKRKEIEEESDVISRS
jgi:hypothetical protein